MLIQNVIISKIVDKQINQNHLKINDLMYLVPITKLEDLIFDYKYIQNINNIGFNDLKQIREFSDTFSLHQKRNTNLGQLVKHVLSYSLGNFKVPNATLKFRCVTTKDHYQILFEGVYIDSLARFFPMMIKPNEIFLTNTGNTSIDKFQERFIKDFRSIDIDSFQNNKMKGIIFGSFPRKSIKNSKYRTFYENCLNDDRDQIKKKKTNLIQKTTFFERINYEDIILQTKKWVIPTYELQNTILNCKWRKQNKIPRLVQINIYGGSIAIDTQNSTTLLINIKKILVLLNKKVDLLFFEECIYDGYNNITDIYLGYTNDKNHGFFYKNT